METVYSLATDRSWENQPGRYMCTGSWRASVWYSLESLAGLLQPVQCSAVQFQYSALITWRLWPLVSQIHPELVHSTGSIPDAQWWLSKNVCTAVILNISRYLLRHAHFHHVFSVLNNSHGNCPKFNFHVGFHYHFQYNAFLGNLAS